MTLAYPNFIKSSIDQGKPLSSRGAARALKDTQKAITRLKVEGDSNISAKIIWTNGEPTIQVKWIGPTT